jgi:tetratricopeptide (TPR) repeat protein
LGAVYNKLQQYDKAIVSYDKAMPLVPHSFGIYNGRGSAYLGLGDNERALTDFNEAIRLNPTASGAYVNRGRVYLAKGEYDAAVEDLSKALRQDSKNISGLLQRARAFELSKQLTKARADFQSVLDILPAHGVASAGVERIDGKLAAANGSSRPANEHSGFRIALVLGNSHYKTVDVLANPERDAKLVADALRQSGFEKVQLLIDGTRDSIGAVLKSFADDAKDADWAVIYYAGHGIEYDGNNFLVPVDVEYKNDADIPKESVALDQVLNAVGGATKLRLVILDACRENPFVTDMRQSGETGAVGKGLARIEPESGTLVAFATKHGHIATDGSGQDSPFATALVQRLAVPGLEINQLFRLVHDDVYAATDKQQEPFTYGQLSAQRFYFKAR